MLSWTLEDLESHSDLIWLMKGHNAIFLDCLIGLFVDRSKIVLFHSCIQLSTSVLNK